MALRIRRTLAHLAIGVVAATAGLVATASPAQAFGNEVFGCRTAIPVIRQFCGNALC